MKKDTIPLKIFDIYTLLSLACWGNTVLSVKISVLRIEMIVHFIIMNCGTLASKDSKRLYLFTLVADTLKKLKQSLPERDIAPVKVDS